MLAAGRDGAADQTSARRISLVAGLLLLLYVAAGAGAWLAIGQGGHAGLHIWRKPVGMDGIPIIHITPGSPADRVGLRAGDLLLAVNGLPAGDEPVFLRAFYGRRVGESSTFRVQRRSSGAGEIAELTLPLTSRLRDPRNLVDVSVVSVVGLLTLAVPLVIALARPHDRSARLLLVAGASFSLLLDVGLWSNAFAEPWLEVALLCSFALACASVLHLFLAFPASHPLLARLQASGPPALRRLGGATLLLYVVPIGLTAAIVRGGFIDAGWGWLVGAALLVGAILAIARSYRQPPTPLARAQLKWILWALLVIVAAIVVVLFPPMLSRGAVVLAPVSVAAAALGLFPVAIAVAVLRYRLFDVNAVLRATLLYPLLAVLLVAGYLGVAFGARWLVAAVAGPAAADGLVDEVVAVLAVAVVAHGARERLQALLDRLVYRERLARQGLVEEANETLSRPQPPDTVATFLTNHAAHQLALTAAWLLPASEAAAKAAGLEVPALPAPAAPLLAAVNDAARPLVLVGPEPDGPAASSGLLPADEPGLAAWLAAGARVLVPLRAATSRPAPGPPGAGRDEARALGELLGIWVLGGRRSGELFDRDDLLALERIGGQAAVLLDYARLNREHLQQEVIRNELTRAREIQERLLPAHLPGWPGRLELAARFRPAREMSGDFYDVVALEPPTADADLADERPAPLQIAVGDVAGKSIPAALVMALARTILRAVARRGPDTPLPELAGAPGAVPAAGPSEVSAGVPAPATTMRLTGALLHSDVGRRDFVCCALAVVEPPTNGGLGPRLRLVNAAQVPPILCRAGEAEELELPGDHLPLGVLPEPQYEELALDLQPGDVLVFSSDGLPEAPALASAVSPQRSTLAPALGPGEMFGFERLAASAAHWAAHAADVEAIATGIWADLTDWCGEDSQHDDMTLVVLRVPPAAPASS